MKLDPDDQRFSEILARDIFQGDVTPELADVYRESIRLADNAGIPLDKRTLSAGDLIAEKQWQTLAASGYMLPDPYSGAPGVTQIADDTWEVTVRMTSEKGDKHITFALRLEEPFYESKLVFSPLLNRFLKGEDYRSRPVKVSDSGRIRNELMTLCTDALEHFHTRTVLRFHRIPPATIPPEEQQRLRDILTWYKTNYPIWFDWLELD